MAKILRARRDACPPDRFIERPTMTTPGTRLVNVTLPVSNGAARLPDGFGRLRWFLALNSAPTT
jgi:hypothetical protein